MSLARDDFMRSMKTLERFELPSIHKTLTLLIVAFTIGSALILVLTPWIQTAYGSGKVDTLNPQYRIQPVSALLDGQIEKWHIGEGDTVVAGQPIVTLVDVDPNRIERMKSQRTSAQQRLASNQLAVQNAERNLQRQQQLLKEGLVSPRDVENVQISLEKLRAELAKSEKDLSTTEMALARQATRTKHAPMDGMVVRLKAVGNATYVKAGEVLAWFVPNQIKRQVSIQISGLDAAIVSPGKKARIQFDGWPAFQFSGWPGVSVGTFAGIVTFIEPVADEQGLFRVWIEPDPHDAPWPDHDSARLGSRVRAWVLLEEVSLGYELWRQLNNFPPENPNTTQG